jgi:hypothetical protein
MKNRLPPQSSCDGNGELGSHQTYHPFHSIPLMNLPETMLKPSILLLLGSALLLSIDPTAAKNTPSKASIDRSVSAAPTTVKKPNITGTWKITMTEVGKTLTGVFNQKGNALTGTLKGLPFGDLPITGTIADDGKLSFSGSAKGMKLSFAGTLAGKNMQGTADLPRIGRKDWTATK